MTEEKKYTFLNGVAVFCSFIAAAIAPDIVAKVAHDFFESLADPFY